MNGDTGDKSAYGYRRGRSRSTTQLREITMLIKSNRGHAAGSSLGSTPQRRTTELGHNHPEYHLSERTCYVRHRNTLGEKTRYPHQSDEYAECEDALVLPPHLASHRARPTTEGRRLARHIVRLVYEQFDAFPTAEDLLYVLDHDVFHLGQLRLRTGNIIRRWRCVVRVHQLRYHWAKGRLQSVGRQGGGRRRRGRGTGQKLRNGERIKNAMM